MSSPLTQALIAVRKPNTEARPHSFRDQHRDPSVNRTTPTTAPRTDVTRRASDEATEPTTYTPADPILIVTPYIDQARCVPSSLERASGNEDSNRPISPIATSGIESEAIVPNSRVPTAS